MFENVTQTYTLQDASMEIFLMLLGAFVLGFVFAWVLKPRKQVVVQETSADSYTGTKKAAAMATTKPKKDDLQIIEGIGPKIETLLNKHGVSTYQDVIDANVSGLEEILAAGGRRYQVHTPTTWPDQAKLAQEGKWTELEEYQEILNAGRK